MDRKERFKNLVKQAWRANHPGSFMFQLIKKTNQVKMQAKKWNKTTFGNIFRQLEDIENQLIDTQKCIILQVSNDLLLKQKNLLRKKESVLSFHKKYWGQRAKIKHIKLIDTNSNYFHRIATA